MNETTKEKMKSLISAYMNTRNDNVLDMIYNLCQGEKIVPVKEVKPSKKKELK